MAPACINVGGCDVVEALVVSLMVVMPNEGRDMRLKVTGQKVVF